MCVTKAGLAMLLSRPAPLFHSPVQACLLSFRAPCYEPPPPPPPPPFITSVHHFIDLLGYISHACACRWACTSRPSRQLLPCQGPSKGPQGPRRLSQIHPSPVAIQGSLQGSSCPASFLAEGSRPQQQLLLHLLALLQMDQPALFKHQQD